MDKKLYKCMLLVPESSSTPSSGSVQQVKARDVQGSRISHVDVDVGPGATVVLPGAQPPSVERVSALGTEAATAARSSRGSAGESAEATEQGAPARRAAKTQGRVGVACASTARPSVGAPTRPFPPPRRHRRRLQDAPAAHAVSPRAAPSRAAQGARREVIPRAGEVLSPQPFASAGRRGGPGRLAGAYSTKLSEAGVPPNTVIPSTGRKRQLRQQLEQNRLNALVRKRLSTLQGVGPPNKRTFLDTERRIVHELRDLHRRALEQQAARKFHGYGKELDASTASTQSERARTVSQLLDQPQAASSPLLQHEPAREFPSAATNDNAETRAPPSAPRDPHADNLPAPAERRTQSATTAVTAEQSEGEAAPPSTSTMPPQAPASAPHAEPPAAPSSAAPAAAKKRSASTVPAVTTSSAKKRSASAAEAATQAEVRRRRVHRREVPPAYPPLSQSAPPAPPATAPSPPVLRTEEEEAARPPPPVLLQHPSSAVVARHGAKRRTSYQPYDVPSASARERRRALSLASALPAPSAPQEEWVEPPPPPPPPAFYYDQYPQDYQHHPAEEAVHEAEEEEEEEDVVIPRPPSPARRIAGSKRHAVTLDSDEEEYLWSLPPRAKRRAVRAAALARALPPRPPRRTAPSTTHKRRMPILDSEDEEDLWALPSRFKRRAVRRKGASRRVIPRPPSPRAPSTAHKRHAPVVDSEDEEYLWSLPTSAKRRLITAVRRRARQLPPLPARRKRRMAEDLPSDEEPFPEYLPPRSKRRAVARRRRQT